MLWCRLLSSPSLEEVDIVELVELYRELEGGLQVAHVVRMLWRARARPALGPMPPPPGASSPRGAWRATAPVSPRATTHARSPHRPHSLHTPATATSPGTRCSHEHASRCSGAAPASPRKNSERNAAAASDVRHTVREPGIHFLIAAGTHARLRRAVVAPPGLQQCAPRLAHLDRCARNKALIHPRTRSGAG